MSAIQQELKKKTINGFFWRFGERISSQLVSFIVSIILARILLPQEYGIIALSMVFINITSVFAVSGLGTSLIQKKDADELDFSTMFYAGISLSIIIYGILYCTAPLIANLYNNTQICPVLRVLGLIIPIQSINSIQQASVSRALEFKKFFYATFTGTFLSGCIGIAMAYKGWGVWSLIGQQLSNHIINTFTLNRIITWRPKLQFSINRFKELFSFGSKLMGANFMGTFFNELKSFIVGIKYTPADLAYYNRGESLPGLIANNINNTINTVLFPAISQIQNNKEEVKKAIRRSMMTSSFIMLPLMFILAATADKIVWILLTEKWMFCFPFMQVLCLNHCINILGTANLQAINAIGRSDITLKLEIIKKPVYLLMILSAMFISPFAIAVATTIYSLFGTIINAWPNKKLIHYKFSEQISDILPQLILSICMSLIVLGIGILPINIYILLFLQITTGFIFYILSSKILKLESYNYILSSIKNLKLKK